MKNLKLFTISLALIAFTFNSYAQLAQKFVLFEHFTNACCGPCASHNPIFQNGILANNVGNVHHIAYHTSWPCSPANPDPMYAYNSSHNNARTSYYSVGGVPIIQMEGTYWSGMPAYVTQTMVENILANASVISVIVKEVTVGTDRDVTITVTTVGIPPPSTSWRIRTAVVEKEINYSSPPGSNGEKYFPNVFRTFLPHAGGETFDPVTQGNVTTYTYTYPLDFAVWDTSQIYVIAFVQENGTRDIINSGSSIDPLPTPSGINDVQVSNIPYMSQNYPNPASGITSVKLYNTGSDLQFEIVDLLGRTVYTQDVSGENYVNFNTSDFGQGVYFTRIINEGAILDRKKMVVVH
ncbi:MAG: Omp28-related outer membrane protein [Bacteroidetes bacterium]|nr:Omp28-related outer membrane protein [Bacteroidota bacterium]